MNIVPTKMLSLMTRRRALWEPRLIRLVRHFGTSRSLRQVREIIAKRIVEAAKNGERNPIRLRRSALKPFHIEPSMPMPRAGVGRGARIPTYA